jgi:uncharacterized protein
VSEALAIVVAYAAPGVEAIVRVTLPANARVIEAVVASGLRERHGLVVETIAFAIFGRRVDAQTTLSDGDRVEITRPLVADAKAIRRARAANRKPK